MNGQQSTANADRVTLTASQLERLDKAVVRRHARTFVDRDGITRVTSSVHDPFYASLVSYHRAHGYLTGRQYARIAWIVTEQ